MTTQKLSLPSTLPPVAVEAKLSSRQARQLAIAAQGLAGPRPASERARPGAAQLRKLMSQVGAIQLDAVNVLERTQFLVPFSRFGDYKPPALRALSGPGGHWFEYWGHAACLLPVERQPLFRWRMERARQDLIDNVSARERRRAWRAAHAEYIAAILSEVTDRGPLAASQLSEPRRRTGEWWDRRSLGRVALEMLFNDGVLAAWRAPNFERVYDLTDRVIPAKVLALPTPSPEEAQRELIAIAAGCLGVATVADLADYFWLRVPAARPRVAELVEDGRLSKVAVEGWSQPAYVLPGSLPAAPRRRDATLISPFDSLIWTRPRTERLFHFHYRIEIYVPGPDRRHGYYVMPLLLGDELVARFDLKADRRRSTLMVVGAFSEPGTDGSAVAEPATAELNRLREWLGLADLSIGEKGDLMPYLGVAALR
ncbi:MAG TPA: crosslink repair DNA glycosylase YcaQ family protein [Acidimicrobiales bacterium]|nr:crosslink repair DNA glycosylase YcaQ family protein [Acidimicrobiales bacterium]